MTKLAVELEGIYSEDEALQLIKDRIDYYKKHSKHGKRFAEIFDLDDFKATY